jgi:hypothetical protein
MRTVTRGRTRSAVTALMICGLLFAAPLADAKSTAQVTTTADWTTLQVTVGGAPPAYDGQSTIAHATAGYADTGIPVDDVNVSGWGAAVTQVSSFNVLGRGTSSITALRAEGAVTADGVNNTYGRGAAYVYRIGYFPVTANGTIEVSLTFDLSQTFDYAPATDTVGGYSEFNIGIGRVNPETGNTETVARTTDTFFHYSGTADQNGSFTDRRTLTVSAPGDAGYRYAIDAFVYVDSTAGTRAVPLAAQPIPLSPLLPLVLTGVIAVGAVFGRRRR